MQVRQATQQDASIIAQFNQAMALETENKHLPDETILGGVTAQLANPGHGYYLVVEHNDEVVGCLGVTFEWSDWRNAQFLWIQSVYVLPGARRLGAFQAMYTEVLKTARSDNGVCGVRLYVEKENERARATYHALGMSTTHYDLLEVMV